MLDPKGVWYWFKASVQGKIEHHIILIMQLGYLNNDESAYMCVITNKNPRFSPVHCYRVRIAT